MCKEMDGGCHRLVFIRKHSLFNVIPMHHIKITVSVPCVQCILLSGRVTLFLTRLVLYYPCFSSTLVTYKHKLDSREMVVLNYSILLKAPQIEYFSGLAVIFSIMHALCWVSSFSHWIF